MTQLDFWIDFVKILGTALITGLTAYFVARFQFLNKKVELENQSEFKARELLYNDYDTEIQKLQKESEDLNKMLGELLTDESTLSDVYNAFVYAVQENYIMIDLFNEDLKRDIEELKNDGIEVEKYKNIITSYNLSLKNFNECPNFENAKIFIRDFNSYILVQISILNNKKANLLIKYIGENGN
jgi:hypothetical protein